MQRVKEEELLEHGKHQRNLKANFDESQKYYQNVLKKTKTNKYNAGFKEIDDVLDKVEKLYDPSHDQPVGDTNQKKPKEASYVYSLDLHQILKNKIRVITIMMLSKHSVQFRLHQIKPPFQRSLFQIINYVKLVKIAEESYCPKLRLKLRRNEI